MRPEITAAVFSDTHTRTDLMVEAVRTLRPDVIIHLGDLVRDTDILREEFPEIPLYSVRGNCDLGWSDAPDTDIVPLGSAKAFITHGHLYQVRRGTDTLIYAAQEAGAQIAMFGHTHEACHEQVGGVTVLNPGTAGSGRRLTYAVVYEFPGGGTVCEIRSLL